MSSIIKTAHVTIPEGDNGVARTIDLTLVIPLDTTLREHDKAVNRMWHLENKLRECALINTTSLSAHHEKQSSARIVSGHLVLWLEDEIWTGEEKQVLLEIITEALNEYGYDVCGR